MPRQRHVILSVVTRVLVCTVLLGIGIGVYMLLVATRTTPARVDTDVLRPRVAVIQVEQVPVQRQFEGYGTAHAFRTANVPAQVRGIVEDLPEDVIAGSPVQRGQLLVQLDAADYIQELEIRQQQLADLDAQLERLDVEIRAALRRLELAQHEVELAEADLQRTVRAQETAGATQREVDQQRQTLSMRRRELVAIEDQLAQTDPRRAQLQAGRGQTEASLQQAQRNVDRTRIVSPIDGVLQWVDVDLGESIQADQPVARVVDLSRIDVPIRMPSSARTHLTIGDEVMLVPATGNDIQWITHITRLSPEDDESARTMTAYVELRQELGIAQSQQLLVPGQFVLARIRTTDEQMRHVIPRRSIASDRIRLIEDGIVRSQRVEVAFDIRQRFARFGIDDDHWVVLAHPLPEGSLVVLDAVRRLVDGTAVEPIPTNATAAGEHGASRLAGREETGP